MRDLNSHVRNGQRILSPMRLPIPPPGHTWEEGPHVATPQLHRQKRQKCLRPDRVGGDVVLLPAYNNPSLDLS